MNKSQDALRRALQQFMKLRVTFFVVILAALYGFIAVRLVNLRNAQPDQSAVSSATTVTHPQIDQATVSKIKQLQDNSVNVQALFNQARQNPFQE